MHKVGEHCGATSVAPSRGVGRRSLAVDWSERPSTEVSMPSSDGWFKPHQSGNPGGMSKETIELRKAARAHTVEALEVILSIMRDSKAAKQTRLMAAETILNRGHGRPESSINMKVERGS